MAAGRRFKGLTFVQPLESNIHCQLGYHKQRLERIYIKVLKKNVKLGGGNTVGG